MIGVHDQHLKVRRQELTLRTGSAYLLRAHETNVIRRVTATYSSDRHYSESGDVSYQVQPLMDSRMGGNSITSGSLSNWPLRRYAIFSQIAIRSLLSGGD